MKARFEAKDYTGAAPRFRVCLLHGNDMDLVEERCAEVTRGVAGALDDPFRVATLSLDEHGSLTAECAAQSLSGGRRAVRVRDCGDRLVAALDRVVPGGMADTVLILLAGVLTVRSKLRGWAEQSDGVAAVLCNADDPAQRRSFLDRAMSQAGLQAGADVRALLLDRLPPGRRGVLAEVEKLALLSGSGEVGWDDAAALLDGSEGSTVHGAVDAALSGDLPTALTHWERAWQGGASGVAFVRIMGGELGRLASLLNEVARGSGVQEALERQRIWPRDPRFRRWVDVVKSWPAAAVPSAMAQLHRAELACKTTGADERLVVSELLNAIAGRASRAG